VVGHLGCFHNLAIVNSAAINNLKICMESQIAKAKEIITRLKKQAHRMGDLYQLFI
jgi:hypothetical protein